MTMTRSVTPPWEACPHPHAAFLGEDAGRNRYLQCPLCGAVLVTDGIHAWVLPPEEAPLSP